MQPQTNTHDNYPENLSNLPQTPEDTRVKITLSFATIITSDTRLIIEVFLKIMLKILQN
jgi:hypothetical protein